MLSPGAAGALCATVASPYETDGMIATRFGLGALMSREKSCRTRSLSSKKSGGPIRCGVVRRSMPSMPAARTARASGAM